MWRSAIKKAGPILAVVVGGKVLVNMVMDDDYLNLLQHKITKFSKRKQDLGKKKVVVLGTGWGALSFIQHLDLDAVDLTVISPRPYFFYTPLLAGTATGTVSPNSIIEPIRWHCNLDLAKLSDSKQSSAYINAECIDIDIITKQVTCKYEERSHSEQEDSNELNIAYDYLIIAVGAEPNTFNIPGVKENAMFLKEIEDGIILKQKILKQLEHANYLMCKKRPIQEVKTALHWVIIGGGPTGVELTAEINDFIREDVTKYFPHLIPYIRVSLLEGTGRILGMLEPSIAAYAQQVLEGASKHRTPATVYLNALVNKIGPDTITYKVGKSNSNLVQISSDTDIFTSASSSDNVEMKYGVCVWAGGVAKRPFVNRVCSKIESQKNRFGIEVDSYFRVKGITDNSVFALGDCAVAVGCAPTAQAASQQGKYLGTLFRDEILPSNASHIEIYSKKPFQYVNYGALAYVGNSRGVAELKAIWDLPPFNSIYQHSVPGNKIDASNQSSNPALIAGTSAFAIWRSLYFSKLMSGKNQVQVAFDWFKVWMFGREIAAVDNGRFSKKK